MYLVKKGFPEVGELVYCEVKSITSGGAFLELLEYKKDAFLPTPEISAGRIRNLRDFVEEGKRIVCVVLSTDPKNNSIIVSLRRVSQNEMRRKLEFIRQENSAEELVKYVANQLKKDPEKLYLSIYENIKNKYSSVYDFFISIVNGEDELANYVEDKTVATLLKNVIVERIKPKFVEKKARISLKVYTSQGVELIKQAFKEVLSINPKKFKFSKLSASYLGGGNYELEVIAGDFKDANKVIDEAINILNRYFENKKGIEYSVQVLKGDKLR
ncbi:MAG: S1 RNA-binding domain-containing protein [Candidatus Woesearchaeota archaeon]